MKVRAKKLGYYNHKRQYEGDQFFLKKAEDFSKTWMVGVGAKVEGEAEESEPLKKVAKKKASKKASKSGAKPVSKEESDSAKPVI